MDAERIISAAEKYLAPDKLPLIERAYAFAAESHGEQRRRSGEPYLEHPVQTALILADLRLGAASLAAALLHDVVEDCDVPASDIERRFGPEVRHLVDGVTKLSRIEWQASEEGLAAGRETEPLEAQAHNLRKMLLAMAEDLRVVFIKLADRLHNMRTLGALPPEKRQRIARETMEIYAPLASRLGIWGLKWQLEDLAFRHLMPDEYHEMASLVSDRRESREEYIARVVDVIKEAMDKAGIVGEVSGRSKHLYSIYTKREKYARYGKGFGDIYDLQAVRILVDTIQDCYSALGVIHSMWHPIPGQFNDYIGNPKANLYQSLHTSVICLEGRPLEIQIRTHEMHGVAEYGVAAHWHYKERAGDDLHFEERIAWLRQLLEWQKEVSGAQEFVDSVKTDIFQDRVFVFTPRGDVKDLPAGATPLDFAYRIHTDLGHRCIGAKINGRLVSLTYQLSNGDVVEIMTTKADRGPSRDWLNLNRGYIHTSHARTKIRQWFRRQERAENLGKGKEMVERELKRLALEVAPEEVAHLFKFERAEELFMAVGLGEIGIAQLSTKLVTQEEEPVFHPTTAAQPTGAAIRVMGVGDLMTQFARCCNPVPGDPIIGFITRSRGVSVHREDCPNVVNTPEKERLVSVSWAKSGYVYPVPIRILALDRVGLVRDVSAIISGEGVNMAAVNAVTNGDGTMLISIVLEISGIEHLSRILSKVDGVRGVLSAERATDRARESDRV